MKRLLRTKRALVAIGAAAAAILTVAVITGAGFGMKASAVDLRFDSKMSGAQVLPSPGIATSLAGKTRIRFNADLSEARVRLSVGSNSSTITQIHIHCGSAGVSGGAMIGLSGAFTAGASGTLVNDVITNTTTPAGPDARPFTCEGMLVNNVASLAAAMMEGVLYVNVHTSTNGGGEVRGQFFGH